MFTSLWSAVDQVGDPAGQAVSPPILGGWLVVSWAPKPPPQASLSCSQGRSRVRRDREKERQRESTDHPGCSGLAPFTPDPKGQGQDSTFVGCLQHQLANEAMRGEAKGHVLWPLRSPQFLRDSPFCAGSKSPLSFRESFLFVPWVSCGLHGVSDAIIHVLLPLPSSTNFTLLGLLWTGAGAPPTQTLSAAAACLQTVAPEGGRSRLLGSSVWVSFCINRAFESSILTS